MIRPSSMSKGRMIPLFLIGKMGTSLSFRSMSRVRELYADSMAGSACVSGSVCVGDRWQGRTGSEKNDKEEC